MNISEYITKSRGEPHFFGDDNEYVYYNTAQRITCADGFSVSVQASKTHYCTPRSDIGPWTEFELGFPSRREQLLVQYAEEPKRQTKTVYGYVPEAVVLAVIEKHGGVKK